MVYAHYALGPLNHVEVPKLAKTREHSGESARAHSVQLRYGARGSESDKKEEQHSTIALLR